MTKCQLPCPTVARLLIQYDQDTGKLFWKPRAACFFTSGYFDKRSNANRWNVRYSGRETFNHPSKNGYLNGKFLGIATSAHRIAWTIFHGAWPEQEIDHINRTKTDNRICNLRQTDRAGNNLNRGANKSRGSHPKGVFKSCGGRWMARIGYKGKSLHGGTFDTIAQASARYMQMHDVITGAIQCPADLEVVANAMAFELTKK